MHYEPSGSPIPLKCRIVSDLLDAAAAALGTPADLVQRSAAARAAETGASVDDILSAWTGGAPVAPAPIATEEPVAEAPADAGPASEEPATAVAVMEPPVIETPMVSEALPELEPDEPLEPVSLGQRVKTAIPRSWPSNIPAVGRMNPKAPQRPRQSNTIQRSTVTASSACLGKAGWGSCTEPFKPS